jgi:hypothetical protein
VRESKRERERERESARARERERERERARGRAREREKERDIQTQTDAGTDTDSSTDTDTDTDTRLGIDTDTRLGIDKQGTHAHIVRGKVKNAQIVKINKKWYARTYSARKSKNCTHAHGVRHRNTVTDHKHYKHYMKQNE